MALGSGSTGFLPPCKFGMQCYRRNPSHFAEFSHPHGFKRPFMPPPQEFHKSSALSSEPAPKISKMDPTELENLSGLFLTKVRGLAEKWNKNSFHIRDILAWDGESFEKSVHLNFMVEFPWLIAQYPEANQKKPLVIVTGTSKGTDYRSLLAAHAQGNPNVQFCGARLDIPYGTHHTKMMLLKYTNGLRIVIHTANLIEQDWDRKTQGMYVSPLCPEITDSANKGEPATKFKTDLVDYLSFYRIPALQEWIKMLAMHDFSKIDVFLVGSVPGRHTAADIHKWGHRRMRKLLGSAEFSAENVDSSWPVIGQFSSIGSLGNKADEWLTGEFLTSLACIKGADTLRQIPSLQLVYPTVENVRSSLEGYEAGGSLPYSIHTAKKQKYLKSFLHQWKSEKRGRTYAAPHIKSYARINKDCSGAAWFLLTSANLSKAAWGAMEKKDTQLMIRSYELGVLKITAENEEVLPFDVPLTPYGSGDEPWIVDIQYTNRKDRHGKSWPDI